MSLDGLITSLYMSFLKPYMVPVLQPWQEDPPSSVHMLALPDDHVGRRSQEANGWSEGERVHQPQQHGEVVRAALEQRRCDQNIELREPSLLLCGVQAETDLRIGPAGYR